jgi:hypothetical protein
MTEACPRNLEMRSSGLPLPQSAFSCFFFGTRLFNCVPLLFSSVHTPSLQTNGVTVFYYCVSFHLVDDLSIGYQVLVPLSTISIYYSYNMSFQGAITWVLSSQVSVPIFQMNTPVLIILCGIYSNNIQNSRLGSFHSFLRSRRARLLSTTSALIIVVIRSTATRPLSAHEIREDH